MDMGTGRAIANITEQKKFQAQRTNYAGNVLPRGWSSASTPCSDLVDASFRERIAQATTAKPTLPWTLPGYAGPSVMDRSGRLILRRR
jgi:hypothetical protein